MDSKTQEHTSGPLLAGYSDRECIQLCGELRRELVEDVAQTGGHLASNLGAVELTVAIHRVFDTSRDRLVFDVGHQCYPHKMLTGRREQMDTLRQYGGIAGFPKPKESVHDAFIAGHASNSVAVALGMARARTMMGEDYKVLALIGDGALTGGLAYEGLSNAGDCGQQLLVILNDNGMSITPNVGAVADHLAKQRLKPQYLTFKRHYRRIMNATWLSRKVYSFTHRMKQALKQSLLPCSMFENMGFNYMGPVDGHDLHHLTQILRYAREVNEPVLLHVKTKKGKGYLPAEENPDAFHGVSPFDPLTGKAKKPSGENFSAVFGRTLARLGKSDRRICAMTAAMMSGTGLEHFQAACPERFFDVGIAEGCAVSMAAGMAKEGAIPVFAVYSTFLQRSYDMLLHDAAIDHLHLVLGVDRAGLVGEDGETHHGVFDVAYLDSVPGMTVLAPSSYVELERMLEEAVLHMEGPVAIRYPRGTEGAYKEDSGTQAAVVLRDGKDITLVSYGIEVNDVLEAARILSEHGVEAEIVKLNVLTPLEPGVAAKSVRKTGALLVAEDCMAEGCVGQRLAAALEEKQISARVCLLNCGTEFVPHGALNFLKRDLNLDGEGIARKALEVLGRG
ncbi:1-deoxy-D-xylulose-5-phosphate synthase [Pseudoflavonifractor sp. AF19-9AC]|uniref:1-deoxy-D-xylulose-5-phosphate synthase n=1 Tax=Pseudoflavonifractor sp. AF19-9AC TaxID=2292244 RepID=UPI000E491301|nr:1-deoxy-D-xylulose-5-phosphate synthase [Pseudoflavonifractor sp. AF19-9AC]RHR09015.1 1-deoxy-D-xylulose-5-phosphate synthase [Pseudoflavonifractor sp. AF19-9AC]